MTPYKEVYIGMEVNPDNMAVMNMTPADTREFFKNNDEYDCKTHAEAKEHYNCVFGVKPPSPLPKGHVMTQQVENLHSAEMINTGLQAAQRASSGQKGRSPPPPARPTAPTDREASFKAVLLSISRFWYPNYQNPWQLLLKSICLALQVCQSVRHSPGRPMPYSSSRTSYRSYSLVLFSPERVIGSYGACERTSEAPLALMMTKRGT
jgi:hypothetical protein